MVDRSPDGIPNEAKADVQKDDATTEQPTCGVIMPISGDGDYTDEHWRRVQKIVLRAIAVANMKARLVWESPEVDVIQARILQGIYESDVLICDVSGLNPNVMLELGLRLSTKRPTIVITDGLQKPPFDIGVFQYHRYQPDLEYNSIDAFIAELAQKVTTVLEAYHEKKYKSFVDNFTFEVVQPTEVTVPAEEALRDRLDGLMRQLDRVERFLSSSDPRSNSLAFPRLGVDRNNKLRDVTLRDLQIALVKVAERINSLMSYRQSVEYSHPGRSPLQGESAQAWEDRRNSYYTEERPRQLAEVDRELDLARAEHEALIARIRESE